MPWATANQKMGFEGILYYGTAGSTASTQLTNVRDITITRDVERGDTTVRGTSAGPPIKTSHVSTRAVNIEVTMLNDSTDASLEAMRVAAAEGYAVALRGKDYASGKGPDGDYTMSESEPWPLNGEQVVTFTCEPTRAHGRDPISYT